jgi:hypothetical protein
MVTPTQTPAPARRALALAALALLIATRPATAGTATGTWPRPALAAEADTRRHGPPVAPADEGLAMNDDAAARRWSEPAAWRGVAERLRVSIDRNPSVEGRRVLQVTIGLRLSF